MFIIPPFFSSCTGYYQQYNRAGKFPQRGSVGRGYYNCNTPSHRDHLSHYEFTSGNKHTLELTFDVFNFTNLINKNWGKQYTVANQAYNILTTVNRTSGPLPSQGKGYNFTINQNPWNLNFGSRFQGQVGLRYTFN